MDDLKPKEELSADEAIRQTEKTLIGEISENLQPTLRQHGPGIRDVG